jgi:hypothetical protein
MKKIILLLSFLLTVTIGFAQNAADYFLVHDIQKQIIPADYPHYNLMTKYSGHAYWCTHIKNLSLASKLQKKIDNKLLVIAPLERSDISNNGTWDCEILDKPKCINDSIRKEILFDKILVDYKWWWSKKRKVKVQKDLADLISLNKNTKPIYENTVFEIHEPWILQKGLICLLYVTEESYQKNKKEKIFIFNRVAEQWVLDTVLQ